MFDFVPFTGARRKVADRKAQTGLVSKLLQFYLPKPQAPAIAPATVGRDQNRRRIRIEPPAFSTPPPPNGGHGKFGGVMVGPHVDKTRVASEVVDAIGIGTRHFG